MIVSSKVFEREFFFYKEGVDKSYQQITENLLSGYNTLKVNFDIFDKNYSEFLQQQLVTKELLQKTIYESLQQEFVTQEQKIFNDQQVHLKVLNEQYEDVDRFKMKYTLKLWMLIVNVQKQSSLSNSEKLKKIYNFGSFSKEEILHKQKVIDLKEKLLLKAKEENNQLRSIMIENKAHYQLIEESLKIINEENQHLNQRIINSSIERTILNEKIKFYEQCFIRLLGSLDNRASFSKFDEIMKEKFPEQIQQLNNVEDLIFRRNFEIIQQFQKGLLCLGKIQQALLTENKYCQVNSKDIDIQTIQYDKETQYNSLEEEIQYQKYKEAQLRGNIDSLTNEVYELKKTIENQKTLNDNNNKNTDYQENKVERAQVYVRPQVQQQQLSEKTNEKINEQQIRKINDDHKLKNKQQRSRTQIAEDEYTLKLSLNLIEHSTSKKKIEKDSNQFSAIEQPSDIMYPEISTQQYPNENSEILQYQSDSDWHELKQKSKFEQKNQQQQKKIIQQSLQIEELPIQKNLSPKQQQLLLQFDGKKNNNKFEDLKRHLRKKSIDRSCLTTRTGPKQAKISAKEQNLTFLKETRNQEIQTPNEEQFIFYDDYPSDFEAQCYIKKLIVDFDKRNKGAFNRKFNLLKQTKSKHSQEATSDQSSQRKNELPFLTYKSKIQMQQKMRFWIQKVQQFNQNKLKLYNQQ